MTPRALMIEPTADVAEAARHMLYGSTPQTAKGGAAPCGAPMGK